MSLSSLTINDIPPTFRETRSVRRNTLFPDALLRQFAKSRSGLVESSDTLHTASESNTNPKSNSSTSRKAKASHNKRGTSSKRMRIDTNQNTIYKVGKRQSNFDANPPTIIPDTDPTHPSTTPRNKSNNDTAKTKTRGCRSATQDKGSKQKTCKSEKNKPCNSCPAADINERVNINLGNITSDNDVRVSINSCGCCQGSAPNAEEASLDSNDDPIQALRNEIMAFRKASPCYNVTPIRVEITPRRTEFPVVLQDGPNPLERTGADYLNQLREEIFKYRKMATEHESELAEIRRELKGFHSCPCTSLSDVNEATTTTTSSSTYEQEQSSKTASTGTIDNTDEYQDARETVTENEDDGDQEHVDIGSSPALTQSVALEVELRLENLLEEINAEGGIPVTHSDISDVRDSEIGIDTIANNPRQVESASDEQDDTQDNSTSDEDDGTSNENREASNDQDVDTSNQDDAQADENAEDVSSDEKIDVGARESPRDGAGQADGNDSG